MKKLVIASALILSSVGAFAQNAKSDMYTEFSYVNVKVKSDAVSISPSAVRFVLGADIAPNISIEGHALSGLNSDTMGVVEYKVDPGYGVFIKAKAQVTDSVNVYARVGWARNELTGSAYGVSVSDAKSGLAGGAGVSFTLSKDTELFVDIMKYDTGSTVKTTTATTGIRISF